MWDRKRQLAWVLSGLILGTFVAYNDSRLDDGTFVPKFFIFMEGMVIAIIAVLYIIYSRKRS